MRLLPFLLAVAVLFILNGCAQDSDQGQEPASAYVETTNG